MATNAPYYQMRPNQLSASNDSSNAAAQTDGSRDGDYVLGTAAAVEHLNENQRPLLYPEHAIRQPGEDIQHTIAEESHNLVELLEAATTAADQACMAGDSRQTTPAVSASQNKGRKRGSTNPLTGTRTLSPSQEVPAAKRLRVDHSSSDSLLNTDKDTVMRSPATQTSPSPYRDSLLPETRAAGVHSATALFRRTPSLTTRKYTRPPMSKLFMSLNITPENFIAIQTLAKAYMLSPAHPERQSCVGSRGKGDTDMVKLRLFNCVRDFLADTGAGEQFFGEHAEKPGERESSEAAAALGEAGVCEEKLVWPRDGNKIISLVTPLMRRMVTNERQRLYAIDTRKGGKKAEKEGSAEAPPTPSTPANEIDQQVYTSLDPSLQLPQSQTTPRPNQSSTNAHASTPQTPNLPVFSSPTFVSETSPSPSVTTEPHLTHINIFLTYTPSSTKQSIKLDEKRISTTRPAHLTFYNYNAFVEQVVLMVTQAKVRLSSVRNSHATSISRVSEDTENLRGLAAAANALQPDKDDQVRASPPARGASPQYSVKTIGPAGWQAIENAESWYHVLTERAFATWADGVCNIIVELDSAQGQTDASGPDEVDGEARMERV